MNYQYSATENLLKTRYFQAQSKMTDINSLIDKVVFSEDGKKLGYITEVIMDITAGKIAYAVMDVALDQNISDRLFALPWDALVFNLEKDRFILNVTSKRFYLAPNFKSQNWPDMADEQWADTIHSFYGTFFKRSSNIHSAM